MGEIDKITGLPKELLDFEKLGKEEERIKVRVIQRRFRKLVTIVTGIQSENELKELAKTLKKKLACGGTVKDREIELQGDHKAKVKEILVKEGYREGLIDA
ncbi:MAG: stress response translation initiation inhibitor YciH [Candidatus Diapherotrites archaeon]|nr:stress response translation initiation inhibitor YciH [Candidatus Diapherotrites archaeon]